MLNKFSLQRHWKALKDESHVREKQNNGGGDGQHRYGGEGLLNEH